MHPAPLPRSRGRVPIAWSLIKGPEETALSFFHLVEEADAASLHGKVVDAGRELIRTYYPTFENGCVPRTPQNDREATWWPGRKPRQGLIDWNGSSMTVYNWIRGQTHPYSGAFSFLDGRRVTI